MKANKGSLYLNVKRELDGKLLADKQIGRITFSSRYLVTEVKHSKERQYIFERFSKCIKCWYYSPPHGMTKLGVYGGDSFIHNRNLLPFSRAHANILFNKCI